MRHGAGAVPHVLVAPSPPLAGESSGALRDQAAGEEWLAATKHDGVEVEAILINKPKVGQALRQVWPGNSNLPDELGLQSAYHRLDVIRNKRGVGAD